MRRDFWILAALLAILCLPLAAGEVRFELLQPTAGGGDFILHTALGRAQIEAPDGSIRALPLQPDELLTELAVTRGGWTATGLRARPSGAQLVLLRDGEDGLERLSVPGPQREDLRLRPVLLVARQSLDGLAWLEGPDVGSLAVHASAWTGSEWQAIELVGPPVRGSQTGLCGAVLADGSRLLVWSAFDGNDDELLWSVARDGSWSTPRPVTRGNRVPDITPAVTAAGNGALLAWSRVVAGHYRVQTARFDGTVWRLADQVAPPGSVDPGFVRLREDLYLLYRHAWPRAWVVAEIHEDGSSRQAVFDTGSGDRPVLLEAGAEAVELRWQGNQRLTAQWELMP